MSVPTHLNGFTSRNVNISFHPLSPCQDKNKNAKEVLFKKHQAQKNIEASKGYPKPGMQNPSPSYVMGMDYFVTQETWKDIVDLDEGFDYIVIGSGHTGYAFVSEAIKRDPSVSILMLERGEFWLPTHFQNLPLSFKSTLGGVSETFPWTLTKATADSEIKYMHGSCPFFGGRSTFWSAWSPKPNPFLMRKFPQKFKDLALDDVHFWGPAKKLLNVISAGDIEDRVYDILQKQLTERLQNNVSEIATAKSVQHAPLSVGNPHSTVHFDKFSTPGRILALYEKQQQHKDWDEKQFLIADRCIVEKLETDDKGNVVAVRCTRDKESYALSAKKSKIILCMGAIPATTLLLNSFPEKVPKAGTRLSGHFLSHIIARIPKSSFKHLPDRLQIAAIYLDGGIYIEGNFHQYHIQITGIHSSYPEEEAIDAARECPDYAACATPEQLKNSENYVLFVCASLGEFDEMNPHNFVKLNDDPDHKDTTCNVILQILPNEKDKRLWSEMDKATYQTIEAMATKDDQIQYWHDGTKTWEDVRPSESEIHIPGVVHETSTLWMDEKEGGGVVDWEYRPHGINNVYVAGGALFPSSGSWNPVLTICGFAQDLARQLVKNNS